MSRSSEQNGTPAGNTPTSGQVRRPPRGPAYTALATPLYPVAPTKPERTGIRRFLFSRLALLVFIVVLVGGYAAYRIVTSHSVSVSVASLKVGECFDAPAGADTSSGASNIQGIQPIPCTRAHDSQVFGKVKITESSFPGAAVLQSEAQADCGDVGLQSAVSEQAPVGTGAINLFPQNATAFASQDYVICAIQFPSQTLTQSYVDLPGSGS